MPRIGTEVDPATEAKQDTEITALQLIDDLRNALGSVNTDDLQVDVKTAPVIKTQADAVLTFYDAAVKTASENSASQASDKFKEGLLEVNVTAVSGTTPTLVVAVETSEDDVTWFHNTTLADKQRQGSLTRLTAPTDEAKITTVTKHVAWLKNLSRHTRLALTIDGTTPSFTLTAKVTPYA